MQKSSCFVLEKKKKKLPAVLGIIVRNSAKKTGKRAIICAASPVGDGVSSHALGMGVCVCTPTKGSLQAERIVLPEEVHP